MHLTLYHGTSGQPFDEFRTTERGTFGSGHYFTSNLHTAFVFAQEADDASIAAVKVGLKRPYHIDAREGDVVDSWGEALVLELFGDRAQALLETAAAGDGLFGQEIEAELRRLGHDGVICRFEDGSLEVNVLDPENIRIVSWMSGAQVWPQVESERAKLHSLGSRP